MAERQVRIAAVGDLHFDDTVGGTLRPLFADISRNADVLALCGDLTTHGRPEQVRAFIDELAGVEIPIVGVLGNHDHDAGAVDEIMDILRGRGIYMLEGDAVVVEGVGFAGVKGFGGGFGRHTLGPFGEKLIKDFVQESVNAAHGLENALRSLDTQTKVVVMHYSPIPDTLQGEPEPIIPYLGSSRLLPPIETQGASVVFHGHAHHGRFEGRTPNGVPVYNVAQHILEAMGEKFFVWTAAAPERRERRHENRAEEATPGSMAKTATD